MEADVLAVSNEASVERKRASAENWNSYFTAPRTRRHEKAGTASTVAPPAGDKRAGARSAAALAGIREPPQGIADAPARRHAVLSDSLARQTRARVFGRPGRSSDTS